MKEKFIAKRPLSEASMWDIAFLKDPQQKYLYVADGRNQKVYILLRETMEILTSFGDGGRRPGQFYAAQGWQGVYV